MPLLRGYALQKESEENFGLTFLGYLYFNIITTYLSLDAKSENVPPDVTTFLGAPLQEVLPYQERQAVNNFLCRRGKFPIAQGFKVSKFLRIQQRGHVFQSQEYTRVMARNCFTVSFSNNSRHNQSQFGQMEYFIHLEDRDLVIVRCLSPTSTLFAIQSDNLDPVSMALSRHWEGIFNDHLPMATKVETSEEIVAIDVNAIRRKNVFVEVGSSTFVSVILNLLESD